MKQVRTERRWSLETLATASGVSRSMLSQIEREEANPTLVTALRIAQALGLSLGELLATDARAANVQVVRADDRSHDYSTDKHCRIRTLSPLDLAKDVELYEVRLSPQGALRSQAHFAGTREFVTVEQGAVRVESGQDSAELQAGDSATFRADVPHAIVNIGREEARFLLVDVFRPAGS
jgi:transcriptional regulator with XRE-family HTH domain